MPRKSIPKWQIILGVVVLLGLVSLVAVMNHASDNASKNAGVSDLFHDNDDH